MPRRARGALTALLLLALLGPEGSAAPPAPAELSRLVWRTDHPRVGGVSALAVDPDGAGFLAVTDRGVLIGGRLVRDSADRLAGVSAAAPEPLRDRAGRPLAGPAADAEGLARSADGALHVAFEGRHRVLRYPAPGARAEPLPPLPDAAAMPPNAGIEALATDRDGRLLAIAVRPPRGRGLLPVWRLEGAGWVHAFDLPPDPPWAIVAADLGPDGRLYLLARDLGLPFGFRSRLLRVDLPPAGPAEVLWETRPGRFGNLEGLALWQDGAGRLRAVMVSDDNFLPFVPTEIVELVLP